MKKDYEDKDARAFIEHLIRIAEDGGDAIPWAKRAVPLAPGVYERPLTDAEWEQKRRYIADPVAGAKWRRNHFEWLDLRPQEHEPFKEDPMTPWFKAETEKLLPVPRTLIKLLLNRRIEPSFLPDSNSEDYEARRLRNPNKLRRMADVSENRMYKELDQAYDTLRQPARCKVYAVRKGLDYADATPHPTPKPFNKLAYLLEGKRSWGKLARTVSRIDIAQASTRLGLGEHKDKRSSWLRTRTRKVRAPNSGWYYEKIEGNVVRRRVPRAQLEANLGKYWQVIAGERFLRWVDYPPYRFTEPLKPGVMLPVRGLHTSKCTRCQEAIREARASYEEKLIAETTLPLAA